VLPRALTSAVCQNATKILGLSPKYLFSLECFTECLPDSDQDVFFDNIQFLNVPEAADEEESGEDSTHVFVLSGWGAPATADPSDAEAGPEDRKIWRCWCAAHRPRPVTSSTGDGPALSSDVSNTIILEFELERDASNPLYPHLSGGFASSGMQSPASSTAGSTGTGGASSAGSASTLVSGRLRGSQSMRSNSTQTGTTAVSAGEEPPDTQHAQVAEHGLVGEDDWQPTPEHIFESTTNRAKPLPALERRPRRAAAAAAAA
jgi:hypothetical protein